MSPLVLTVGFDSAGAYSALYCGSSLTDAKSTLADAIASGSVSLGWIFQNPVPIQVMRVETVPASVRAQTALFIDHQAPAAKLQKPGSDRTNNLRTN